MLYTSSRVSVISVTFKITETKMIIIRFKETRIKTLVSDQMKII